MDLIPGPAIRARELGVGDNAYSRATQSERQPTPTMGTASVMVHYPPYTLYNVNGGQKVAYSAKIVENISNMHTAIELYLVTMTPFRRGNSTLRMLYVFFSSPSLSYLSFLYCFLRDIRDSYILLRFKSKKRANCRLFASLL
jgi:hypothetical protein